MQKKKYRPIKSEVLDTITSGKVKMTPRWVFGVYYALLILGISLSWIYAVYLLYLFRFLTKSHGPMMYLRWNELISAMPWWLLPLGILSLICGWLGISSIEFFYKKKLSLIVTAIALSLMLGVWIASELNIGERMFRSVPRKMNLEFIQENIRPGQGRGMNRF
jgi:hypothetical protein